MYSIPRIHIAGAQVSVAAAAAHAETAALPGSVYYAWSTNNCHLQIGAAPAATTADFYLPAQCPILLRIAAGDIVSAIKDTGQADGTLRLTPVID